MKVVKVLNLKNLTVKLIQGDITKSGAEAIVNAANKYLEHRGGVAAAIAKACAESVEEYTKMSKEEMKKQIGRDYIEHGEVVVTSAMKLEKVGTKYVIHTVGPICAGAWNDEFKRELYLALKSPLEKAEELKVSTIAYPAVSAGIYGCPLDEVVKTFMEVVKNFKAKNLKEVWLVLYDEVSVKKVEAVFK